jgi:phosphoglycerol transferase MdoB-like AlkP superfamily enzyme
MFRKVSFTLSFGSKKQWLLFALFLGITFLQCCLFHWLAFNSILVSSLWKNPLAFWAFYLPKISISLFIASFVFLFKRQVWTIIFSALLNIWIMAELMYFRANRIFLDAHSFSLISNMDGFWSSVPMYMYASDLLLLIPTALLIGGVIFLKTEKRGATSALIMFALAILLNIYGCLATRHVYDKL